LDAGLGRIPETTIRNKDRSKGARPGMTTIYKISDMEEDGRNNRTNKQWGVNMVQEKATAVGRMW
jgi:hypothetical protein